MTANDNSGPGYAKHPGYEVALEPLAARVRVTFAGTTIADSTRCASVRETSHRPVIYVPRDDVDFDRLTATEHATYCPFKGDARYWDVRVGDAVAENAVWGYDAPYDEVSALAGYVAFYADRVDIAVDDVKQPNEAPGWIAAE